MLKTNTVPPIQHRRALPPRLPQRKSHSPPLASEEEEEEEEGDEKEEEESRFFLTVQNVAVTSPKPMIWDYFRAAHPQAHPDCCQLLKLLHMCALQANGPC